MTTRNVNKHINRIGTFLLWCVRQGSLPRSPAEKLSIRMEVSPDAEREAYDSQDLEKVISAVLRADPAKPERFWIPLIALFSGMRLNEICQLYTTDIIVVDQVPCFDINAEADKQVKTISGKRVVPIHPLLIDLGFMALVRGMAEAGEERIWSNLPRRRDGYSQLFVHWYQRYNRLYITQNPKRSFHSFRHAFADNLKQQGVAEGIIGELMGHANDSITTGRYGKRYRPGVLVEAIVKLNYAVDLDRLSQWSGLMARQ